MTAGLAVLAVAIGTAAPLRQPTVGVTVQSRMEMPGSLLVKAQQMVEDIYRHAGVAIEWRIPTGADAGRSGVELAVVIVRQPFPECRIPDGALGMAIDSAASRGRLAYVFFDRVRDASRAHDVDLAIVLALTMAHEIGHLLLPFGSHTSRGLMRAEWAQRDLRAFYRNTSLLTSDEGRAIRTRLGH